LVRDALSGYDRGHRFAKLVAHRKGRQRIASGLDYVIASASEAIEMPQIWIASSLALLAMTACGELDRNDSRGTSA
jgi:hypothetical protein